MGKKYMMRTAKLLAGMVLFTCGCGVSKPGNAESKIASEVKHRMTIGGKNVPNSLPATDKNIVEGREHSVITAEYATD